MGSSRKDKDQPQEQKSQNPPQVKSKKTKRASRSKRGSKDNGDKSPARNGEKDQSKDKDNNVQEQDKNKKQKQKKKMVPKKKDQQVDKDDPDKNNELDSKQESKDKKKRDKDKKGMKQEPRDQKGVDDSSARSVVLEYMTKQNRPYSLINIFDNLHKSVKKTTLQQTLEELCKEDQLSAKAFGRAMVYMLYQGRFKISNQEMESLSSQLAGLREQEKELGLEIKNLNAEIKSLQSKPKLSQMQAEDQGIQSQIVKLQYKMQIYGGNWTGVPQSEVLSVEKTYEMHKKEAKQRQKLVRNTLNDICEMQGKKLGQVVSKIGVQMR